MFRSKSAHSTRRNKVNRQASVHGRRRQYLLLASTDGSQELSVGRKRNAAAAGVRVWIEYGAHRNTKNTPNIIITSMIYTLHAKNVRQPITKINAENYGVPSVGIPDDKQIVLALVGSYQPTLVVADGHTTDGI